MESIVLIGIIGLFKANAIPLAKLKPILNPVYEPGPIDNAIASKSLTSITDFWKISSTNWPNNEEWFRFASSLIIINSEF